MSIPQNRTPAEEAYLCGFAEPEDNWLANMRRVGMEAFRRLGLPHRRIEEWKYTDLRNLIDGAYPPMMDATIVDIEQVRELAGRSIFAPLERATAVFADGRFCSELSSLPPQGAIEFFSLAECLDTAPDWLSANLGAVLPCKDDPVSALNMAYPGDGAIVRVKGKIERPLELLFIHTSDQVRTLTSRNLIVLEDGACLELLETHVSAGRLRYLSNIVTEVKIGDGASLDHVKMQAESPDAIHLSNLHLSLGAGARLKSFSASTGAHVSRNQVFAKFAGEDSKINISGVHMLAGKQHGDTTLAIDHAVPNCTSRELFKLVLDDRSRGVFQGKVTVRPQAQKTDGQQKAQALLLAPGAEFDGKPELEIFADDVVCGHGATAGELDEEHLFYLQARGIPRDRARALLISSFVAEAFEEVSNEAIRKVLGKMAGDWLFSNNAGV